MEQNKKLLKIGLLVISISLIFSMTFAFITKLKRPVFLKNYSDNAYFIGDNVYSELELILPYITDISDDRYITDVIFDEAPEMEVLVDNNYGFGLSFPYYYDGRMEQSYGRYKVKNVYLKLNLDSINGDIEQLELNNASILFEDGENINVDIGKIRFFYHNYEKENKYLESLGSGSSSDGTGNIDYRVLEDITLLKLESTLIKELDNIIELNIGKLNYLDIEGIEYKKRNSFSINYRRHLNRDIMGKYITYNISPDLYYKDNNGNVFTERVREIRNNHYNFNFFGILKYLRARGEI